MLFPPGARATPVRNRGSSYTRNTAHTAIFEALLERHRRLSLIALTNGLMVDEKMAQIIIERFESTYFSIDSMDPAIYEKVRSKPALDVVLKNIEYFYGGKVCPDNSKIAVYRLVERLFA